MIYLFLSVHTFFLVTILLQIAYLKNIDLYYTENKSLSTVFNIYIG